MRRVAVLAVLLAPATALGAGGEAMRLEMTGAGSSAVKLFLLLTALSFAPAIAVAMTSFTRVVIVLSFLRHALGAPQLPPNQVVAALSLFLTLFVMTPTFSAVHERALGPYLEDRIGPSDAMREAAAPLRTFMLRQVREQDLKLFLDMARVSPRSPGEVPLRALAPAFLLSELQTAFRMGFLIFLPFLVVDLVVASVLMALGMMMVPPSLVSLPLKLLLFVLADGWRLVVESLVRSFGV
jgi:flagellar biosynthetic protein FliP